MKHIPSIDTNCPPKKSWLKFVWLPLLLVGGTTQFAAIVMADELATDSKTQQLANQQEYERLVKPFLSQHCQACHDGETQSGELRIDSLAADFLDSQSAGNWIEVMDQLNLGQMPPAEEPRPAVEELRQVTAWIAAELRHAERVRRSAGGKVVLRRFNRAEYANTIRDLLAIKFLPGESPQALLPPDGTAEGFDKVSLALMLDPSLLEKYFEAAQRIAAMAIVDGPPEFATEVMRYELEETKNNRAIRYLCATPGITCREHDLVLMSGSTRSYGVMKYPGTNLEIPVKGMYRIRVRAWAEDATAEQPVIMQFRQNHPQEDQKLLLETAVTEHPQVYEVVLPRDPKCGEYNVSFVNGAKFSTTSRAGLQLREQQQRAGEQKDFTQVIRLQSRQQMECLTWGRPTPETADTAKLPKLVVDWIECEGPLYDKWPPQSHQQILFRGAEAKQDREYIEAIFQRLLPRAFRRPATPAEVSTITDFVAAEFAAGESFHDAVRAGLVAVLCSPKFLYLIEPSKSDNVQTTTSPTATVQTTTVQTTTARPLNDWELASRLSYYLWSSMPDEELFRLAGSGQLRNESQLLAQVERMISDPRSAGLVQGFAAQWLRTDEFRTFTPDNRLYKEYDSRLGESMVNEALEFFSEILRCDSSALNMIDSDWTMLNERLADFYGIDGITGDQFRRVALPAASPRGGLLGMAGVAMLGSDGNRTKPVLRGVYIRDVLFNDPPDPPPPNAGEVEPNIKGEKLTVRERLIQHQQIESCAACHRGIDGYGLAMENFNVIGAWRERQDGEDFRGGNAPPIDASGTLPNGQSFSSFAEFKALLLEQRTRFARGLSEKMLVYALGRPIEPTDRGLVDQLAAKMAGDDYSLVSLIQGIVTSDAFLTK
ncbi:DUF1592 domain-containing protein [Planctomycetaceae bacterium SH139]